MLQIDQRHMMTLLLGLLGSLVGIVSFLALDDWHVVAACLLGGAMLVIAVSDAQRFIIPDIVSLPMIPAGLLATGLFAHGEQLEILIHLAAAVGAAGLLWMLGRWYAGLRGREGLGFGDVKLAAVAGAWTGPVGVAHTLLLASVTGLAVAFLFGMARGYRPKSDHVIPFGTFFGPAIWLVWVYQSISGA